LDWSLAKIIHLRRRKWLLLLLLQFPLLLLL
jgi:hypothetical protein